MPVASGLHPIDEGISALGYDAASLLVFAAFTTPPSDARKTLINALVVTLKNASLWTKLDVLYILAAADAQAAKINWKLPGTSDSTEVNSPTFTADRGFTGVSTAYLDTNYNPATYSGRVYAQNSAVAFAWSLTSGQLAHGMVSNQSSTGTIILNSRSASDLIVARINLTSTTQTFANTVGTGLYAVNRTGSTTQQIYKDGASQTTASGGTSAAVASVNANLFRSNSTPTYWLGQMACAGLGQSLTAGEHTDLYNGLRTYMTGVGVP